MLTYYTVCIVFYGYYLQYVKAANKHGWMYGNDNLVV